MHNLNTYKFNSKENEYDIYYLADELYLFNKKFFIKQNIKSIIKKYKIKEKELYFSYKKKGEWVKSNNKYKRAKLFIKKKWADDNLLKDNHLKIPNKIYLKEDKQFTDGEYYYDITIRGNMKYDKCYFKVKDVEDLFELKSLRKRLTYKESNFIMNEDYKIFHHKKKKVKYFTCKGILKCLYTTRSNTAHKFQEWMTKIFYVHQFGNDNEKHELAGKLLGVHAKAVKEVLKTASNKIPCVYLFILGKVKDLRKEMKINKKYDDDYLVCKYGYTDDLKRRTSEHMRKYNKIKNVELCLKYYSYIDPINISKAENDIKGYFEDIDAEIEYKNYKELVVLNNIKINDSIKKQYKNIQNMYVGHSKDLIMKMERIENKMKLREKEHKIEILEKKNIILKKENENNILLKEKELIKKDNELLKFKLEYQNNKSKNIQ